MRCNGSNWAVYSPGSWDGFRNDVWASWAGVIMRLEHHLVGGHVRYISPHIILLLCHTDRCQESCKKAQQCTTIISDLEQTYIDLKPPTAELPIGRKWIRSVLELLIQREADKESAVAEQEVMVHSGRVSRGFLSTFFKDWLSLEMGHSTRLGQALWHGVLIM